MATPNVPLQRRAGRNIGIEPGGAVPFVQDAGGRETEIARAIGAYTVILECPDGVARNPSVTSSQHAAGLLFNKGAEFFYEVRFRDTLGNEVVLIQSSISATDVSGFDYGLAALILVLAPGEKIVIKSISDPG